MKRELANLLVLAGVVAWMPSPASADVLEVGAESYSWVAGGPAGPVASIAAPAPVASVAPLADGSHPSAVTQVPIAAGPAQWQARVAELSAKYDISPTLIEALVWQESRWNPSAVSPVGARGLAQLMPGTARSLGVNPDDPRANLEGGARYLRQQLDAFGGDLEKALAAYNAGPGRVRQAGGIPAIRETQDYVTSIMGRLSRPVRK